MKTVTVTTAATSNVTIQDSFPNEGTLAVTIAAGDTTTFQVTAAQYERIEPQLETLLDDGQITEYRVYPPPAATIADMDLYVDPAGDDDTGDGTASNPFETINRAYACVPALIKHAVHIHIAAGAYTDFPTVNSQFGDFGFLSFDASAAMADVDAGPYTLDAGGWTAYNYYSQGEFPVVGGGLTINGFRKKFVKYLTGDCAGTVHAVYENSATAVVCSGTFTTPSAGDTFKVVEPGAVVTLTESRFIQNSSMSSMHPSRIGLFGLKIVTPGYPETFMCNADLTLPGTVFGGAGMVLSGVHDIEAQGYWPNSWYAADKTKFIDDAGLVAAYGSHAIFDMTSSYVTFSDYTGAVWGLSSFKGFDVSRCGAISFAQCGSVDPNGYGWDVYGASGSVEINEAYSEAKNDNYGVRADGVGLLKVTTLYSKAGAAAVRVGKVVLAQISRLVGVAAGHTNGILMRHGARASIVSADVTLVGSGGAATAVAWGSGAAAAGWPAANNEINDLLGAQVIGS